MNKRGKLVVISGFSGSGKGTVIKELLNGYKEEYVLSVSATSRKPREGEIDGQHYFFKSRQEFEKMIENNELIEFAEYVGNYYGTPGKYVEDRLSEGKNVILEIEVVGGSKIKQLHPDALMIYLVPPSIRELHQRLLDRQTESPELIHNRISQAGNEIGYIPHYDFLVVNRDLKVAVDQLHYIIQSGLSGEDEKLNAVKVSNNTEFIQELQREMSSYQDS